MMTIQRTIDKKQAHEQLVELASWAKITAQILPDGNERQAFIDWSNQVSANLSNNHDIFDESLVQLERKRFSVTQGEVLIRYAGEDYQQFGDDIQMRDKNHPSDLGDQNIGGWSGHPDSYFINAVKDRLFDEGLYEGNPYSSVPPIKTRTDEEFMSVYNNFMDTFGELVNELKIGEQQSSDQQLG